jgi:hypothetical protein
MQNLREKESFLLGKMLTLNGSGAGNLFPPNAFDDYNLI